MSDPLPTYPDAPAAMIARWEERRDPLDFAEGEALPSLDADLAVLRDTKVPDRIGRLPRPASGYAVKRHALSEECAGGSELVLLHAVLISCLRKREWPEHAPALFRRLWREESRYLLSNLSNRWLISAMITFAAHGETEEQRRLGQSMNILFSLMKLYEAERLFSGRAPDQPYRLDRRVDTQLPLGMPGLALIGGGLDVALIAPIWAGAQAEPLAGPLACHLLDALNREPGSLFRRLAKMRERKMQRQSQVKDGNP